MDTEQAAAVAFTELYRQMWTPVARYLARRTRVGTVDDLASEVFVIAWRRWPDVPLGRPLPWLYGVARNVLANDVRGGTQRSTHDHNAEQPAAGLIVGDLADGVATRSAVRDALAQLSECDREVLLLSAWEGLTTSEIGTALSCTSVTAAVRLHRARRRFHHLFTNAETDVPLQSRVVPLVVKGSSSR